MMLTLGLKKKKKSVKNENCVTSLSSVRLKYASPAVHGGKAVRKLSQLG